MAGAQRGTLTCFAGGDAAALDAAQPLLSAFAQRTVPCGEAGSGYRFKLINQALVGGVLLGLLVLAGGMFPNGVQGFTANATTAWVARLAADRTPAASVARRDAAPGEIGND